VQKENIYRIKQFLPERSFDLELRYMLGNGKMLIRSYPVSEEFYFNVMQDLYTSQEYKQKNIELFTADIGHIYGVELANSTRLKEDEVETFLTCLRADLRELTYADIHNHEQWNSGVYIEYIPTEAVGLVAEGHEIRVVHERINASFTKTVAWLLEHGYLQSIITNRDDDLVLLTAAQWEEYNRFDEELVGDEKAVAMKEMKKLSDIADAKRVSDENVKTNLRTFMVTAPVPYEPDREYAYYLCRVDNEGFVFKLCAFYDTPEVEALFSSIQ